MNVETFKYDNRIVRAFAIATVIWGLVGFSAGLLIACQLFWPDLNLNLQYTTFGRLRPLHTNAVIFAFVGNGMFMGIYYSLQRLCKARMFSDFLSWVNFWGWQSIIVGAALTLPLGLTTSKEYAELEWPIDLAITVVWVAFTINLIGTILKRREKHLYVAIWFYIATAITIAVLHMGNSMAVPAGPFKSYSMYAGVQDALMQWWYAHNAVAFFLTTPYLGLMYPWLLTQKFDTNSLPARIAALRKIGVPYPAGFENGDAQKELSAQAAKVVTNLKLGSVTNAPPDTEIIALIAYLQRLGADIKAAPSTPAPAAASKTAAVERMTGAGSNYLDNIITIINGVPEKGMLTWRGVLKPSEIQAVASYIYRFRGTKPPNPKLREDQAGPEKPNLYE